MYIYKFILIQFFFNICYNKYLLYKIIDIILDISDLVTFLQEYDVKIFNKNEDVYDTISKFLTYLI